METSPNPRHKRLLAPYAGTFERADAESLGGWCIDQRQPDRPLKLLIFVGPVLAGEVLCSNERTDLAQILGEICAGGFTFAWDSCGAKARAEVIAFLRGAGSDLESPSPIRAKLKGTFTWLSDSHLRHTRAAFPSRGGLAETLEAIIAPPEPPPVVEVQPAVASVKLREALSGMPEESPVKAIAFYLPQFHPIPENDLWWGKGFTEWRNVTQAQPLFEGHQQPRVPADLGYYDLRLPEVREAQAELARSHGIHGFCYYYYWFAGKRLLELPLDAMIESGSPDFPFCLCWANESWSRRWDGSERDVLMEQKHSPELDLEFARSVEPYFRDRRYIRVDGKPLLVIYRPNIIPDLSGTITRWREYFREVGIGEVHLVSALTFGFDMGQEAGFDAEVQFPPHGLHLPERSPQYKTAADFSGKIVHYEDVAKSLMRSSAPGKTRYFTVMLNWDNTARKKKAAHVYHGYTLDGYERFLNASLLKTEQLYSGDNRIVFINAWNEWAEGTYLEPDATHGMGALERTRDVLKGIVKPDAETLGELLPILTGTPGRRLTALAAGVIEEREKSAGSETLALLQMDEPESRIVIQGLQYQQHEGSLLWLESLATGTPVEGAVLTLSGWVISRFGPCSIVEVLVGGEVAAQTRLTQIRDDVFDYHARLGAIRGPNTFSIALPREDLVTRFGSTARRLAISLRVLGTNAQVLVSAELRLAKQLLPSTLQLMSDRGLLDAAWVEDLRNGANRFKPHLFVIHDPYPAGAQLFMLRFQRWLRRHSPDFRFETLIAVTRSAPMIHDSRGAGIVAQFRALGPVHYLDPSGVPENQDAIRSGSYRLIYLNSLACIRNLRGLPASTGPLILHMHELHSTVELLLGTEAEVIASLPARFVACSDAVRRMLVDDLAVPAGQVTTVHAFVPEKSPTAISSEPGGASAGTGATGELLELATGLSPKPVTILLAGSINWRKGAYVLAPVARALAQLTDSAVRFVWVGDLGEEESVHRLQHEFKRLGIPDWLHLAGRRDDIERYYAAADIFLLPSLEDPFPLVMLEAAMTHLPIVAFENAGGATEFISDEGGGIAVPYLDMNAMAQALLRLVQDPELRSEMGRKAYASAQKFSESTLAPRLLEVIVQTRAGGADLPTETSPRKSGPAMELQH